MIHPVTFRTTFAVWFALNHWLSQAPLPANCSDNCAKDGGEKFFLPRCIAYFNRIPIELLKISHSNAMHLRKNCSPLSFVQSSIALICGGIKTSRCCCITESVFVYEVGLKILMLPSLTNLISNSM